MKMNRKERRRQMKTRASIQTITPSDHEIITKNLEQANTAMRSGNRELAARMSDDVLRSAPNHPDAMNILGTVRMASGDTKSAIKLFTKVASLIPEFAQAHFNLGTALNAGNKSKRAIKSLQIAIGLDPDYADAHYNLANALRQIGQTENAIAHYDHALRLNPEHSAAATNLASAHLELGNARHALTASQHALKVEPGNRDALAFTAIASTECGAPEKAAEILKPDRLVRPKQFTVRPGYMDLESFNAALIDHVLHHPTLTKEPHNKATRNGQQTENLALGERGPVAEFQNMIGEALDEYLKAINLDNDHPYPPLIPNLTKIDIWGTVLGAQGHQAAHMHRAAWVSGVYYVKLPDVMQNNDNSQDGWIEFCRPPDEFNCKQNHDVIVIEPKEGTMVMFPSYIYHRTIPFQSDDKRISIAFDLLA